MRVLPLLYLGVSALFHECCALLPGIFGGGIQHKMLKLRHEAFQQKYPGQTCELIPNNMGLSYPEYHAGGSHYATKLISLNSYVCADTKFAEPYYKMEAVHLFDEVDHHIFDRKQEPGVERSIGFQENGFMLGLAKYYDIKKKPFNIYTGKYLRSPKGHGTVNPSKPKHKKKPRDSSDSNPQAKNKVPILNAKVAHKKVTSSGGSETIEEPYRDSSTSKNDVKEVAQKAKDHGKSKLDKDKSRKEIANDKKSRKEDLKEKGKSKKDVEKEEKKKRRRKHHRNN